MKGTIHDGRCRRRGLRLALALVACATSARAAAPVITVVYPPEGANIAAVDSIFVLGSVTPPEATLRVNGAAVPVYRTGGFLAFIPVHSGQMQIECVATSAGETASLQRTVSIAARPAPLPDSVLTIDSLNAEPADTLAVLPGDVVNVRVRASPGATVWFTLGGQRVPMPPVDADMTPDPSVDAFGEGAPPAPPASRGVFAGSYVVQPTDRFVDEVVTVSAAKGLESVQARARGHVTVLTAAAPHVVEFVDSITVARAAPAAGYVLFAPSGVRARVTGLRGAWARVALATSSSAWVPKSSIRLLPEGTPPPLARVGTVHVEEDSAGAVVRCIVSPAALYRIREETDPGRIIVTLYGVTADVDWIRYMRPLAQHQTQEPYVREVRWSVPADGQMELSIEVNGLRPWGYHPEYANGEFRLRVSRPPEPLYSGSISSSRPLAGMTIVVDAGHSPDTGATGPTGLTEREANIAIARALGERLSARGASVVYTREDMEGVDLRRRVHVAVERHADLLVSVHLNALPDGVNPFSHWGTSVYYYHPHSLALAEAVHRSLRKRLGLPDFGLYYGNLQLTRPTEMPAILTESTFLMHPEQEEWVRSVTGQRAIAGAIAEGVETFVRGKSWRAR